MRQSNISRTKTALKLMLYALIAALNLTLVYSPEAAATEDLENCFKGEGSKIILDEPWHSQEASVSIVTTCSLKIYYLEISFASAKNIDELDDYYTLPQNDQIRSFAYEPTESGGKGEAHIWWNEDEADFDTRDGRPYIDVEPNDRLFTFWYTIQPDTTIFKRNMPITINSIRYDTGEGIATAEDIVVDAILTVAPDVNKEVLMISGITEQQVVYTGEPVELAGNLTVETNEDGVVADSLTVKYYTKDSDAQIERPTALGDYKIKYSFESEHYRGLLTVPFAIIDCAADTQTADDEETDGRENGSDGENESGKEGEDEGGENEEDKNENEDEKMSEDKDEGTGGDEDGETDEDEDEETSEDKDASANENREEDQDKAAGADEKSEDALSDNTKNTQKNIPKNDSVPMAPNSGHLANKKASSAKDTIKTTAAPVVIVTVAMLIFILRKKRNAEL